MAESVQFKVALNILPEDPVYTVRWYQSTDGITWDILPTDEVALSTLIINTDGKYVWDSLLVDASKYHLIKTVTQIGIESIDGIIIPPRSVLLAKYISGVKLNNNYNYIPGESIELILRVDDVAITSIGNAVHIDITDEFGNILEQVIAERIGSIYVASYTIPLDLSIICNPLSLVEEDTNNFILYDKWHISGQILSFKFLVSRYIESPTSDNAAIHVSLTGITDAEGLICDDFQEVFTTRLNPFYSTVHDVRSVGFGYLDTYDDLTLVKKILNMSRIVDEQMKPHEIYNLNAFNLAVKNYVKIATAIEVMIPIAQTNQEQKRIDTFSYSLNSAQPSSLLGPMEEQARKYALFIWAGGNDTPFVSKTFTKGLYDPNRPNLARADFDSTGWFPYLNSSSKSYIVNVDGNDIEVRGERGVAHKYLFNRYSNYSLDSGDAGYLAGV